MWARKWMDTSRCFAERLIAFICVEGMLFTMLTELVSHSWYKAIYSLGYGG